VTAARLPAGLLGVALVALRTLHYAALGFALVGWAIPDRNMLIGYLAFLPLVALQWRINRDTCVLDNVESWLRYGRYRAGGANPDEGSFIANLIERVFGYRLTPRGAAWLVYGLMVVLFAAGAGHLAARSWPA
jgi:hypothetical protein